MLYDNRIQVVRQYSLEKREKRFSSLVCPVEIVLLISSYLREISSGLLQPPQFSLQEAISKPQAFL